MSAPARRHHPGPAGADAGEVTPLPPADVAYWISFRHAAQLVAYVETATAARGALRANLVDDTIVAHHDARTALCDLRVAAMLAAGHPLELLDADGHLVAGLTRG